MADKLPFIQIYPGDWLRDEVSGCSLAAQGLWLRLMFLMHDSERYGYLMQHGSPIPPATAARRVGIGLEQYEFLLIELADAGIPSYLPDGTIFSRRMVRDAKRRLEAQANGRKGGNPALVQRHKPPDKTQLRDEVNPPNNLPLKMKEKMKYGGGGEGEGEERKLCADAARLLDETGLGTNIQPHKYPEVNALLKIDGYESARRGVDEALSAGIGGPAAIAYAAKVVAGDKAQQRLRATKSNGANGRNSAIGVRKDR